ncbi:hypothetical protein SPLC1_S207890 [Arthrospira platensis C1]|nr:hypothetical protein SPLC1_S207890 [Arthrospira platensis C1]
MVIFEISEPHLHEKLSHCQYYTADVREIKTKKD